MNLLPIRHTISTVVKLAFLLKEDQREIEPANVASQVIPLYLEYNRVLYKMRH